jgi:hypothetical protein
MQIHELNRPRPVDEGWMDVAGTALKHAIVGGDPSQLNSPAASAGILDPKQKLAAVMKEPAMVELATKYADEWAKKQAQAVPESVNERRVGKNKKNAYPSLGGKPQIPLNALPPHIQQQIQAQEQPAATVPNSAVAPAHPAATAVTDPAKAKYLKDFLEFANEKIAMRDPTTYKMIGLTALYTADKKYSLRTELDAAKKEVIKAQGDPAATKEAVKNYILTALAAAQLMASGNKVAAATPQAPALGRQAPAPGKTGAAATTTPTSATGQISGSGAVALLNNAALTQPVLAKAGQAIQTVTGNRQLSTTGDSVIDAMLEGMGYTVS